VTLGVETRSVTTREVAERLRKEARVLAVSHEAPDGDALGCLSAILLTCELRGVACSAYVPGRGAFPAEYSFLPGLQGVMRGDPPQLTTGTTVYFLDCASSLRGQSDGFAGKSVRVNIDHHPDNPGFAEMNLLDRSAPSTTAILHEVFKAGGFPTDARVATALYVGLVTDTGRFQYSNTTPAAHRIAAELQEEGCDIGAVYHRVYESTPLPKVRLMERMLSRMELRLGEVLAVSWLGDDDFTEAGADEGHAEGLIDTLRCVEGVRVAVLAREKRWKGQVETKVSLRSNDGAVDVADLAHERGGGGHMGAAGFTSEGAVGPVLSWVESNVKGRL
jgi:phosphoesterase RecJ-like protein